MPICHVLSYQMRRARYHAASRVQIQFPTCQKKKIIVTSSQSSEFIYNTEAAKSQSSNTTRRHKIEAEQICTHIRIVRRHRPDARPFCRPQCCCRCDKPPFDTAAAHHPLESIHQPWLKLKVTGPPPPPVRSQSSR